MRRCAVLLSVLALSAPVAIASAGPAAAAVPTCHGKKATIVGTKGNDSLTGTGGNDVIVAKGGNDQVFGGAGNDIICGNAGADRLFGGIGADHLYGGIDALKHTTHGTVRRGDTLTGSRGNDYLQPDADRRSADKVQRDSILWNDAPKGVTVNVGARTANGNGHDVFTEKGALLVGSSFSDTFYGGPKADIIVGNSGADTINGNGGNDQMWGDPTSGPTVGGNDQILGGDGADTIYNTFGHDVINAGPGRDKILDSAGVPDSLNGGSGKDRILTELASGAATQLLDGGGGTDQLNLLTNVVNSGGDTGTASWDMTSGALTLTLTNSDPVDATAVNFENGVLASFGTVWHITGTSGANKINVATTNGATFDALAGNDTFTGSQGDDTFNGGADTDRAIALGTGFNTCSSVEVVDQNDCDLVLP